MHIHYSAANPILRYTWDSRDQTATVKMTWPLHETVRSWLNVVGVTICAQLMAWAEATQHCVTPYVEPLGTASWPLKPSETEIDQDPSESNGKVVGQGESDGDDDDDDNDNGAAKDAFWLQADDCLVAVDSVTDEYLLDDGFPTVMFEVAFSQTLTEVLDKAWKWLWWSGRRIQAVVVYKLTYPVKASGFKAHIGIFVRGGQDMSEPTIC